MKANQVIHSLWTTLFSRAKLIALTVPSSTLLCIKLLAVNCWETLTIYWGWGWGWGWVTMQWFRIPFRWSSDNPGASCLENRNKLKRVHHLARALTSLHANSSLYLNTHRQLKVALYMATFTHCIACGWFLLACKGLENGDHSCAADSWVEQGNRTLGKKLCFRLCGCRLSLLPSFCLFVSVVFCSFICLLCLYHPNCVSRRPFECFSSGLCLSISLLA